VPSKRQPSKQRRAAENRAKRQALAARSEHAQVPRSTSTYSTGAGSSGGRASTSSTTTTGATGGGLLGGLFSFGGGSGPTIPGYKAVQMGAVLSLVGFVISMLQPVKVDDRGEEIPQVFMHGLYMQARSLIAGKTIDAEDASLISARGWTAVALLLIPVLIAIATFVSFRKQPVARTLTISMLLMAVAVVLNTPNSDRAIYMMPALIAIAVGSFQVRKAGMLEAQRNADPRGAVIDAEAVEDDEDLDDEELDEVEFEDDEVSEYEDGDEYDEFEDDSEVDGQVDNEAPAEKSESTPSRVVPRSRRKGR
jgi:hypothetical protein